MSDFGNIHYQIGSSVNHEEKIVISTSVLVPIFIITLLRNSYTLKTSALLFQCLAPNTFEKNRKR